jgi:uncharacterized delta-60 repeat protein
MSDVVRARSRHRLRAALAVTAVGALGALALAPVPAAQAAVAREGTADTSFSGDGLVDVPLGKGATRESAADGAVLSDGSVIAVGAAQTSSGLSTLVRRFTPGGAVDLSFEISAVAVTPDDRIVVAGRAFVTGGDWFLVARFLPSGGLDTSFSGDGWDSISEGTGENVEDVVVDSLGRVTVLGRVQPVGDVVGRTWLGRWTNDGVLDTSFDTDGRVLLNSFTRGRSLAFDGSERLMLAGSTGTGTAEDAALARLTSAGALDTSFYTTGTLTYPYTSERDYLTDVQTTPAGGIVAAGAATSSGVRIVVTLRLDPSGQLDPAYGYNGGSTANSWTGDGLVTGLAVQADGRPVVAVQSDDLFTALRLARAGTPPMDQPDPTFGSTAAGRTGSTTAEVPGNSGDIPAYAEAVLVDRRGRVVLVGSVEDPSATSRIVVARFVGDTRAPGAATVSASATTVGSSAPATWSATDVGSGVRSYDVRARSVSASSSSFSSYTTVRSATASSSGSLAVSPGRTTCFSARARDAAGNVGPWGTERCTTTPVDDRSLSRSGSWTALTGSAYYRSTALKSSTAGATLTYASADYRRLAVVVRTCATCGSIKVYRGSTLLKTISLVSTTTVDKKVITVQTSSTIQRGDIRIRQNSGGKPVTVDGLVVSLIK